MSYTNFDEFFDEFKNLSASEALVKAKAKRYWLIVERGSVTTRGVDSATITRNLDAISKLIELLERDVNLEAGTGTVQMRIWSNL